ncbi:MAG TPA: NADPH-dependent FMN reductase [Bacilli bacterium]
MNIAILAGSNHAASTSTQLIHYMVRVLESNGHAVQLMDLFQRPVPFYTPDTDFPDDSNLLLMKEMFVKAQAIILSTPEYHGGVSGVLKNALDHLGGEHFNEKVVLSVSSAGGDVAVSSLLQLQAVVRNVHGINCPEWISIGGSNRMFTAEGEPENPKMQQRVKRVISYFITMAEKLNRN